MSDCDVKEFKLCELLKIYNGTKYDHLNKGDIPLYGSGGLMSHVDEALYSGEAILLPRKGTLSNIMYVNESFWTVDTMYYAVVNDKLADAFYLYSYLSQLDLSNLDSGSTLPSMTKSAYESIVVKLPDLKIQKAVATILFNIRKKLETNNKINQELEAMAKTLYDYWFVQFDFPDQNAKPYKSSGGKMVYNPELKREIPEGWGVEKLGELAQFKNGINYEKTSSGSEKVKIINVRNISSSRIFINQTDLDEIFLENDKSTNFIVNEGMILITRSGIPGATRLVSELEAKTVYSGFIIASEVNDLIYKNLIFYYLKNVEEVLKNQSAGTIMKNISQSVLTDMVVSLPPQNLLLKFNSIIDNLLEQMKNVQRQNQELTQLRDWLLPMLMNGQVKVE
ncbi:restriction endonuclease subunit S [Streptococcus thermophilus]|uniref:restriction endonuclease subunit S n=1 Tax=Streptococcus thermophilus TaxID=1308 RepID=UPI001A99FC09|nr:restriction endonuclease subunit S [Streptococcus thermophilus]MBO1148813.1 restriction endonuclease subunit S [Streptococcus thermophilus]MBO1158536.1 restriction endonuclease subunit S [Streptococcus thermophilus]MBO1160224.1 restriction endonuclease subunit S [Streptococcus thermophilus]QTA43627.1 restriction endonuclease subunit S [Streptococcus thermophilus]QTA45273.1 restriction endonuclease subunit S [Streptococcus thermophilus]